MLRKTLIGVVIGVSSLTSLVAAGCTSAKNDKPYALTGNGSVSDQERKEQMRWTDDKGHYRADLRQQGGRPIRNIP